MIDGDGVSDDEIPIAVAVTVGDDFLHADFTGCAPQTRGPVNCTTGALLSACKTVVRAITAPGARSNDGFFRPFSLTVPPGTIFSAEAPAPTGWYYEGAAFANDLIWKALAPVVPERLGAGSYASLCCSYIVGTDEAGELFVLAEPNVGGWGGSALGDGASALIATTDGDTYNFPVEVVESRFPVLVQRYALNVEAGGGAGRHRGGFGVVREYRVHGAREASGYGSIGGFGRVPWPLGGGAPGTAELPRVHDDGSSTSAGAACPASQLEDGAVVSSVTGTGGGFGDPFEREPERVRGGRAGRLRDASPQARADYGVALDPVSLEPTRRRRPGCGHDDAARRDRHRRHLHRPRRGRRRERRGAHRKGLDDAAATSRRACST